MTQIIIAAFGMGILGSFHCVGMCGPLALSLPIRHNGWWAKFSGAFMYNAGRVVTYSVFGLVFGLIGQTFALFGFQQWLSIILGLLILFFIILPKRAQLFSGNQAVLRFFERLRESLGRLFSNSSKSSLFSIGLLNGLLPCGLVYMAVAGSVATADVLSSVLFMAVFGLGTLPVMWSVAFFGNYVGVGIRQRIRKVYPYMLALMACLLILRGMGLGIPFLSPKMSEKKEHIEGCCSRTDKSQFSE